MLCREARRGKPFGASRRLAPSEFFTCPNGEQYEHDHLWMALRPCSVRRVGSGESVLSLV